MKRNGKRLISMLLIALLVCTMLPTSAFAALETGEDRQCKFQILYVSDEFYVGYNYGDSWNVTYTCQYTTGHSGYNHSIACSVIKEQVDKAKGMVGNDWDVKGWSKTASKNPTIFTTYTGTTATQTSYTIYIVAKKNAVTTNYSLSYDGNGASSGVPATQTGSSTTGSYTFTVSTQKPVRDGYEFLGWSSALNGSVDIGETVALTSSAPTKAIYAVWKALPVQTYTVTYTDGVEGEEVFADQVYTGLINSDETPAFVGTPTREGYVFYGWNPAVANMVTGDATYTAIWEVDANGNGKADKDEDKYTVTYTDGVDDEEVFPDQVTSDILSGTDTPAFNGNPAREGYVFYGWNPSVAEKVTADATYTATWEVDANGNGKADKDEDKYTVTYTDGVDDEEVFADQVTSDILSGTDTPAFNGNPAREGYVFYGWNPSVAEKVTDNATYTATWEVDANGDDIPDKYQAKVTFKVENGKWDDQTTEDKTVYVTLTDEKGEWSKDGQGNLTDDQIPAVGQYPNARYKAGSWDVEPSSQMPITEDCVFTYTYQNSAAPVIMYYPVLNLEEHQAYIMGYPDGGAHPNEKITRAEVATIFFRLLADESRNYFWTETNCFSDVTADKWYNNAISTLARAEIMSGYPDGTFRPNAAITRAEMAQVVSKFADLSKTTSSFMDIHNHWAESAIELAAGNGWIAGYPDGSFRPNQAITRAETVTMINRVLERVPADITRLFSNMVRFTDCTPDMWFYVAIQEAATSHTYERTSMKNSSDENWVDRIANRDWTLLER